MLDKILSHSNLPKSNTANEIENLSPEDANKKTAEELEKDMMNLLKPMPKSGKKMLQKLNQLHKGDEDITRTLLGSQSKNPYTTNLASINNKKKLISTSKEGFPVSFKTNLGNFPLISYPSVTDDWNWDTPICQSKPKIIDPSTFPNSMNNFSEILFDEHFGNNNSKTANSSFNFPTDAFSDIDFENIEAELLNIQELKKIAERREESRYQERQKMKARQMPVGGNSNSAALKSNREKLQELSLLTDIGKKLDNIEQTDPGRDKNLGELLEDYKKIIAAEFDNNFLGTVWVFFSRILVFAHNFFVPTKHQFQKNPFS